MRPASNCARAAGKQRTRSRSRLASAPPAGSILRMRLPGMAPGDRRRRALPERLRDFRGATGAKGPAHPGNDAPATMSGAASRPGGDPSNPPPSGSPRKTPTARPPRSASAPVAAAPGPTSPAAPPSTASTPPAPPRSDPCPDLGSGKAHHVRIRTFETLPRSAQSSAGMRPTVGQDGTRPPLARVASMRQLSEGRCRLAAEERRRGSLEVRQAGIGGRDSGLDPVSVEVARRSRLRRRFRPGGVARGAGYRLAAGLSSGRPSRHWRNGCSGGCGRGECRAAVGVLAAGLPLGRPSGY